MFCWSTSNYQNLYLADDGTFHCPSYLFGTKGAVTVKVAYERVSTAGQSTLRQDVMMQEQKIEKVFTEKIAGKDRNRPKL